jgi:hypothetical protein
MAIKREKGLMGLIRKGGLEGLEKKLRLAETIYT